ncbi:MAG: response regulator [Anaerolineaceae bacterium]|nr:response regulator [Anaerolineaceae bacterium]
MLKIVVIDDEMHLRSLIKSFIPEKLGIKVVGEASNGVEGLEQCLKLKPEIVITDIRMPEMDGLALIEKLSQILPEIRVIVVSGFGEFAYAQKAIQYGAVGYLLKPIEEKSLYLSLEKAIEAIEMRLKGRSQFDKMKLELNKLQSSLFSKTKEGDEFGGVPVQSESPVVQKMIEYIYKNYNRDISLEEIATKMYMNNTYLSRLFKEKTGQGFHDFLVEVRLKNAKLLLESSEFKVNEIADMSGYRDVSHFIVIFKEHLGMTPSDYRRQTTQEVNKTR